LAGLFVRVKRDGQGLDYRFLSFCLSHQYTYGGGFDMVHHPSGKLLEIQPQQFDLLLQTLAEKTPPKPQTVFSTKEIVGRLYDFISQALANHYSFDELVPIIQSSLLELQIVEQVPELKGSTIRQYYLEMQREREQKRPGKRSTGGNKTESKSAPQADKKPIVDATAQALPIAESPLENPIGADANLPPKLPKPRSSNIELAY
jgi:hypothetical protein